MAHEPLVIIIPLETKKTSFSSDSFIALKTLKASTTLDELRWHTYVSNVCTKANRTLGFLRRNLYSCPREVKETAYKGLVRPVLDYGSSVWDPPV